MIKPRDFGIVSAFILYAILIAIYIGGTLIEISTIHVYDYGSSNSKFTYKCFPEKRKDTMEDVLHAMEAYDPEHGTHSILCRKFKKNYLKYWMWPRYRKSQFYQCPYCQ